MKVKLDFKPSDSYIDSLFNGKAPEGTVFGRFESESFIYSAFILSKPYTPEETDSTAFYAFIRSDAELICAGFDNDSDFTGEFKAGLYIHIESIGPCGSGVIGYVNNSDDFESYDICHAGLVASEIIAAFEELENGNGNFEEYEKVLEKYKISFTEA